MTAKKPTKKRSPSGGRRPPPIDVAVNVDRAIESACKLVSDDVERIRRVVVKDGELEPRNAELLHKHMTALAHAQKIVEAGKEKEAEAYANLSDAELARLLLVEAAARRPPVSDEQRLVELGVERAEIEQRLTAKSSAAKGRG